MPKININTATLKELELLPGIGTNLAKDILAYIKKNGPFKTIAEIDAVKGISAEMIKGFSKQIAVGKISEKTQPISKKYTSHVSFRGASSRVKGKIELGTLEKKGPLTIEFKNTKLKGRNNGPLEGLKLTRLPRLN